MLEERARATRLSLGVVRDVFCQSPEPGCGGGEVGWGVLASHAVLISSSGGQSPLSERRCAPDRALPMGQMQRARDR